jgi:membrane dipeptidase
MFTTMGVGRRRDWVVVLPLLVALGIRALPGWAAGEATSRTAQAADRLGAIHERTPFVDLHAHPSRFHRANVPKILPDELARYRAGLIDLVVCNISSDAIYSGNFVQADGTVVPPRQYRPKSGEAYAFTLERLDKILQTVRDGDAVLAMQPETVFEARRQGKIALLAALEGADGLEGRLDALRDLFRRGLRLIQLVHFRANELGHIQTYPYSPGGLTPFGAEVVREANRLGLLVDLAHANTETIMDAVRVSRAPVLFSHTGVKALADTDRALADEEIRAIARTGGVVGIWPNGDSVPRMADLVRHVDYVRRLVGIDHVGIGSDLRGMSRYTEGFGEEADFRAIAQALLDAGLTDEEVGKVMGGNFMRVWRRVVEVARSSR